MDLRRLLNWLFNNLRKHAVNFVVSRGPAEVALPGLYGGYPYNLLHLRMRGVCACIRSVRELPQSHKRTPKIEKYMSPDRITLLTDQPLDGLPSASVV